MSRASEILEVAASRWKQPSSTGNFQPNRIYQIFIKVNSRITEAKTGTLEELRLSFSRILDDGAEKNSAIVADPRNIQEFIDSLNLAIWEKERKLYKLGEKDRRTTVELVDE